MDRSGGTFYDPKTEKEKIHVSSLKIFDGEDLILAYGDRKKMQHLQQKDWIEQQVQEKEERINAEKEYHQNFAAQTLELNKMRKALEDEHAQRRKIMEQSYQQSNQQLVQINSSLIYQALQKADLEKEIRKQEEDAKKNHIEYNMNHDFYTENPETCKSHVSANRVLKYHWKGMSELQRNEILAEQEKQRKEAENIKKMKEEEERLYAIQAEHQRKMLIQIEREKQRRKDEILRNQKEFNLLKNEEQKIKVKTMYG